MKKRPLLLKVTFITFILLFAVNSYFLFKKDSNVERSYYLHDHEVIYAGTYEQYLPKQTIVAAKETVYVTESATSLDEIRVKEGQEIASGDILANYFDSSLDQKLRDWKNELSAYTTELEQLNTALTLVEEMGPRYRPSSSINSSSFNDLLSVNVKAEIMQEQSIAGAIAILKTHIAETDRKITVLSTKINQSSMTKSLTSPINGTLGAITHDAGFITFEIHAEVKTLIAYVTEEEWKQLEVGQNTLVSIDKDSIPTSGVVEGKEKLPAAQSIWYEEYLKQSNIEADETVYEIRFTIEDLLLEEPYALLKDAHITLATYDNSSVVNGKWVEYTTQELLEEPSLYMLGYDGKIRHSFITQLAEVPKDRLKSEYAIGFVELPEKEQDKQLQKLKQQIEEEEQTDITIIQAMPDELTTILPKNLNDIYAPTFLPMQLEKISFKAIGKVRWQDVAKYLIQ